jgi:hypothetical protein
MDLQETRQIKPDHCCYLFTRLQMLSLGQQHPRQPLKQVKSFEVVLQKWFIWTLGLVPSLLIGLGKDTAPSLRLNQKCKKAN